MNHPQLLQEEITGWFADKLHLDVPSAETDLFEIGILDSLKFVELLVQLEQQYGTRVSLDDLDMDNFRSIARIAQYVASRNGQA
jgi:acyl carrier protein